MTHVTQDQARRLLVRLQPGEMRRAEFLPLGDVTASAYWRRWLRHLTAKGVLRPSRFAEDATSEPGANAAAAYSVDDVFLMRLALLLEASEVYLWRAFLLYRRDDLLRGRVLVVHETGAEIDSDVPGRRFDLVTLRRSTRAAFDALDDEAMVWTGYARRSLSEVVASA